MYGYVDTIIGGEYTMIIGRTVKGWGIICVFFNNIGFIRIKKV